MKRSMLFYLVLAILFILSGCGGGNASSSSPTFQSPTWQNDGNGFLQFTTNDPHYYSYNFWSTYNTHESIMSAVTATVKKASGNANSGYGIIFCQQDVDNFYRLMITINGHYAVTARVAGVTTSIIPWSAPSVATLYTGYGVENLISVVQTTPYHFAIYFNGVLETTFTDPNFYAGWAGFYVWITDPSRGESFPGIPADVRFKMSGPIVVP